jgi:hypothetical protein
MLASQQCMYGCLPAAAAAQSNPSSILLCYHCRPLTPATRQQHRTWFPQCHLQWWCLRARTRPTGALGSGPGASGRQRLGTLQWARGGACLRSVRHSCATVCSESAAFLLNASVHVKFQCLLQQCSSACICALILGVVAVRERQPHSVCKSSCSMHAAIATSHITLTACCCSP